MTTEQKLDLLEICQEIYLINKKIFEFSAQLTGQDLIPLVKATDKLLDATIVIHKSCLQ